MDHFDTLKITNFQNNKEFKKIYSVINKQKKKYYYVCLNITQMQNVMQFLNHIYIYINTYKTEKLNIQ